jgi:hypothetical protein
MKPNMYTAPTSELTIQLYLRNGYPVYKCGVVWCGVVWCGVVWCGVVWCGVGVCRACTQVCERLVLCGSSIVELLAVGALHSYF